MYKSDSLYHIFVEVIKLHFHRSHQLLDKIGVYPGQPHMLFALSIKDGQSQSELAEKLHIKPATVTVMLNKLEKNTFIERKPDSDDQRVSRVYLTEKGKVLCKEVNKIVSKIEKELFKNINDTEKSLLRRLFLQMKENMEKRLVT